MRKKFIAGNWKMNGLTSYVNDLAKPLSEFMDGRSCFEMLICPPFHLIDKCVEISSNSNLLVGAQNCHTELNGAHTGDISAEMIKDIKASHVIVGHSERRSNHAETNAIVNKKAKIANEAGLVSIICVGEVKEERESGQAINVVSKQLEESIPSEATAENTIVAYEPVWAIGTGLVASIEDVKEMHQAIREKLAKIMPNDYDNVRVLYGGSVKPDNASDIMNTNNVDGVLVGGASLKADSFIDIAKSINCECK